MDSQKGAISQDAFHSAPDPGPEVGHPWSSREDGGQLRCHLDARQDDLSGVLGQAEENRGWSLRLGL